MTKKVYDWSKYPKVGMYDFTPEEQAFWPMQAVLPKWKIPDTVCLQVAISGGGARITPKQNPYHPGANLDNIRDSADEVLALEEGPTIVHFDHDTPSCQTRDGKKMDYGDSYAYVIEPLIKKYGWEKLFTHVNCLRGDLSQQMLPVVGGFCEMTYTHPRASPLWQKTTIELHRENGVRPEIAIHVDSEIELANRLLIKTGLMPNPNIWCMLVGLPGKGPRHPFSYIPNERAMCEVVMTNVERIREVDPEAEITINAAGRAARYIVLLGLILGLNVRVGMEDTVFQYPFKDDPCKSNAEEVVWGIQAAKLCGRRVLTPNEWRAHLGQPARHSFELDGRPKEPEPALASSTR